jgi:putative membrane protein
MRRVIGLVIALVIIFFGLSFSVLNAQRVGLDFYFGRADVPLSMILFVALTLGAVLGVMASIGLVIRQRREVVRLRRRVGDAQKELTELRKLPIRNAQ